MIDYHKKVFNIFSLSNEYSFSTNTNLIKFTSDEEVKKLLSDLKIDYTEIHGGFLEVNLSDFNCELYESEKDFLHLKNLKKREANILILSYEEKAISYIDKKTYVDFTESDNNYFFTNSYVFEEFISFLKSQESDDDKEFHFIDYFSIDLRKIIITNLSDKSRTIIKYSKEVPNFGSVNNYSLGLEKFKSCFTDNHQPKFLKNSLVKHANRFNDNIRFENIFKILDDIVMLAKVNFEVYINNLSIDKIKKDYDDFKSKYFKELSDILSKITNKIIGLPIAVAGTLYAINRISAENQLFLYLIAFVITITSIYIFVLIKMNFRDLNYLKKVFMKDYELLKANDFFKKFPNELNSFSDIKDRISKRISTLKFMSEFYFWILSISNILIVFLIFRKLKLDIPLIALVLIFATIIFCLGIYRNYITDSKKQS